RQPRSGLFVRQVPPTSTNGHWRGHEQTLWSSIHRTSESTPTISKAERSLSDKRTPTNRRLDVKRTKPSMERNHGPNPSLDRTRLTARRSVLNRYLENREAI